MSGDMEDGDVILIAPPQSNQDGSQTFYILDPCPSSEDCTNDSPEIELIDLTAEVKNTGAIAVLSTNSNTGALEITLTKKADKLKVESMDPQRDTCDAQLNGNSTNVNSIHTDEVITDDDFATNNVKEEDEDVDVEEVSFNDPQNDNTEQRSEQESSDSEVVKEHQEPQNDPDEEAEEGTLYIVDDAKYSDISNELARGCDEGLKNVSDIVNEEVENVVKEAEIIEEKLAVADFVEDIVEEKSNHLQSQESSTDNSANVETVADDQEALIHGQLIRMPTENESFAQAENEYVESTNTALTLLELAGSTSFRNPIDPVTVNPEFIELEQAIVTPEEQFVTLDKEQSTSEAPSLTPLQPVPAETPVISEISPKKVLPPSRLDAVLQLKSAATYTPRMSCNIRRNNNNMVQRLLASNSPMRLISPRPQYRHLVTQSEITQEFLERSQQKYTYTEPSGGDHFFAMKLAHRLATHIVPPDNPIDNTNTEKSERDACVLKSSQDSSPMSKRCSIAPGNDTNKPQLQKNNAISDKYELLKILEDDPDDPVDLNQSKQLLEKPIIPVMKKSKLRSSPLIKLHPELERELALKQLQDFSDKRGKRKSAFIPEMLQNVPKADPDTLKKHENNNNLNTKTGSQTNLSKRKSNGSLIKSNKKIKPENVDCKAATVDPNQITETLTVEGQSLAGELSKDCKSIKQYSNKRLSRGSETPPLEVPMEILLNGVDDLDVPEDEKNLSKNKIFKATNPRKRQEELQRKRQKHFANVLQRNKPHKKRGRPPKKKLPPVDDMFSSEFLALPKQRQNKSKNCANEKDPESSNAEGNSSSAPEKLPKTKKMREIERLLGDEGAINMLYSVEQKRTTGSEPKRGMLPMLPSYRRKKKDLQLKTKLVKSAVLRLTTNPPQASGKISLRGQSVKEGESEENSDATISRKMSVDSHDSHHSLSSPQHETFSFPAKVVPAEASRIIRRHSSSSNYSSRSNSPRRPSVDGDRSVLISPELKVTEIGQGDAPVPNFSKHNKELKSSLQTPGKASAKMSQQCETLPQENSNKDITQQSSINVSVGKCKSRVQFKTGNSDSNVKAGPGRPRKKFSTDDLKKTLELNTSLAAAINDFTKEIENIDKNIPSSTPKTKTSTVQGTGMSTRTSTSKVAVYKKSSVTPPVKEQIRKKKTPLIYSELTMKRHDHLVEIILAPITTKLKNALNTDVLRQLTTMLSGLAKDDNCRMVLITSTGSVFCQGIDFFALIHPTAEKRMSAALETAVAIKDFVKTLAMFSKPVVAGVQGAAVGLGTTMLPLFDFVFAHETATFHTPYAKLGQVPEGAATLTLPSLLGPSVTSELLFACRKLTAAEAQQYALVTRILSGANFHEELRPIVTAMASQSAQSMDATKALLRHNLVLGLETTLMSETHLLIQHWTGTECQANFTRYLQDEDQILALQKQPT